MQPLALETVDLTRTFKAKRRRTGPPAQDTEALAGVSLTVPRGELFGLLGPNGAGKTTVIKILVTLLLPTSGTARVLGFDVAGDPKAVRRRISMVSGGETTGFGLLTCREQLWMFSQFHGLRQAEATRRIDELLEVLGLGHKRDAKVGDLSTGLRQRLNLARGLLTDPEVLFLDEPTVGLDVEAARHLRSYVRRWMSEDDGRTILLTTHYLAEADELCDRVAIISGGRILACDTPAALRKGAAATCRYEVRLGERPDRAWPPRVAGLRQVVVADADDTGAMVTAELGDPGDVVDLVGALAPWRVLSVNQLEQSLEDVFVEIVGARPEPEAG